jgi:fucose 4-O-acetylase-like acetyltransferase
MKRLSYIDRVKGLLVISVVLGHAAWSIGLMDYNYPYVCYPFNTTTFLYVGIFMQAYNLLLHKAANKYSSWKK